MELRLKTPLFLKDLGDFAKFLHHYLRHRGYDWFSIFEVIKNKLVDLLYKKRGKEI